MKSCGAMQSWYMQLKIEHKRTGMESFSKVLFRKRMMIGY